MKKLRNQIGVTISEVLLVLAIISVLSGVGFVEVNAYMRDMTKLEYDGYAKEIFIAAQNHLAMAESQGYLAKNVFGESDDENGGYYFVSNVDGGTSVNDSDSVLGLMLPAASLDETIRSGNYIVRYDKQTAQILDVFYWSVSGRYSHQYDNDYADFMSKRKSADELKTYNKETDSNTNSVIGYFGGVEAASIPRGETLQAPMITVINGDTLRVEIIDPNINEKKHLLQLIVKGSKTYAETPGLGCKVFTLKEKDADPASGGAYSFMLDDITAKESHFSEKLGMHPGEDITLQAKVSYAANDDQLGMAYSPEKTTNSLFGDGTKPGEGKVVISSIRHLENLDQSVSKMDLSVFGVSSSGTLSAVQTTDLKWKDFLKTGENIVPLDGTAPEKEKYYPVTPGYQLSYDGDGHAVYDVSVKSAGNAGMFGTLDYGSAVSDLKLVNFNITGENSGALAGAAGKEHAETKVAVTNVLAINNGNGEPDIVGSGSVGGLIGSATDAKIVKCAAAMLVRSTGGNAGGLIGTVTGRTEITACYSGGHTEDGCYTDNYNVTGAQAAGGLIGASAGAGITYSYSTCSVSGKTAEGGFVGSAAGGHMENCYAAGRVDPGTENAKGAFAGNSVSATNCHYYMIVNEIAPVNSSEKDYSYLPPYPLADAETEANMAFDWSAQTFDTFVGGDRKAARPYDSTLLGYYRGKYGLLTAEQLGASGVERTDYVSAHYGDWPAPEIWVINN